MMGHPSAARAAYRAGSPVHRLENIRAPLLIAHGQRDDRVNPAQSEELVAELRRLGKAFEYVTYPTEAAWLPPSGPAARLLPAPRALPRLVPDVARRARAPQRARPAGGAVPYSTARQTSTWNERASTSRSSTSAAGAGP
jgi:dienelactone hydrolase